MPYRTQPPMPARQIQSCTMRDEAGQPIGLVFAPSTTQLTGPGARTVLLVRPTPTVQ